MSISTSATSVGDPNASRSIDDVRAWTLSDPAELLQHAAAPEGVAFRGPVPVDGLQLAVHHPDTGTLVVNAGSDALAAPVVTGTLHSVFCAGKPLMALVIASFIAEDVIGLDTTVGQVIREAHGTAVGGLSVRDLLTHRTGLYRFATPTGQLVPGSMRKAWLLSLDARPGHRQVYDDYVGSLLLQWLAEAVGGRPLRSLMHERVIEPLGLTGHVFCGFDRQSFDQHRARIGVDAVILNRPVPGLMPRSPRAALDVRASLSVYATMRGMAELYTQLGSAVAGAASSVPAAMVPVVQTMIEPGDAVHDPVLRRRCSFGLGFMTDLSSHDFGRDLTRESFGHAGYAASTAAFHDPVTRLTVAVHWNAIIEPQVAASVRRPRLIDHITEVVQRSIEEGRGDRPSHP
jgi:CubicO group peptidase (beta-lactamase class C family)